MVKVATVRLEWLSSLTVERELTRAAILAYHVRRERRVQLWGCRTFLRALLARLGCTVRQALLRAVIVLKVRSAVPDLLLASYVLRGRIIQVRVPPP